MYKYILTLVLFLNLITVSNAQSYLGYVTKQVNFRTESNTTCKVISSLPRGAALFVISKDKINGFYQVLDIDTNKEGFVHSSFVQLDRILPKNKDGIFTPVGKTSSEKPVIKIFNNTVKTLTLKLNDKLYSFSPKERKTLTLSSGSYSYRASAPGVLPDYGTELMKNSFEYEWSFYISTTRN
ncbi:SH3 domain-containing protein [Mesonia algae]|uniref:SH3 domain-containing protein n=1 Tax=Mesonia algae TaxID=213248 RepID=A0A2W7I0L4_9FLAO|nr:SH3 domain-containing protein [Mesonia algae]PZW40451.1 SH3 domain-containing protein [Mesonia algae]